ncbi:MAG: electron transfer flavoprotein subunit alpha/FixB family protein [Sulfobacillus acidophilus]|uniref:Electron transfer flavoprotein subunit alpha/FixB family protein n=1 Tax=Sulfobacillus acidophilus TaxID=53633 RepID=A0A2T2WG31_9FIRM|nr:MAG: electron transfer flavoprotein subunit alpha/FixB family protein [Sulfobacillus acidophilus]
MADIVVVGEIQNGVVTDATQELLTRARDLATARSRSVAVLAFGKDAEAAVKTADADEAVVVVDQAVEEYNPGVYEATLVTWLTENPALLILLSNTTMGMDLGAALAARLQIAMIAYCTDLRIEGSSELATCQIYGGKLAAEVELPDRAVVTVIPGSWAASGRSGIPMVHRFNAQPSPISVVKVIEPDASGDVDITRADILVSVGRGIQDPDNLELADELAQAIGGVVSCSRPVVDAGWLPRSRQVGKSGQTVKPKLYLALGISGAPEHLQGMKDAELIVAVNSDENAPIFDVAHYGATADILDLMPALTEKLNGRNG